MKIQMFTLPLLLLAFNTIAQRRGGEDPVDSFKYTKIDTVMAFDYVNGNWVKNYDEYYDYTVGNLLEVTIRDRAGQTAPDIKKEYQYDANRKITEIISLEGNFQTNAWSNSQKETFVYDTDEREIEKVTFTFSGGNWVNLRKEENIYSGIQHQRTVFSDWNTTSNSWEEDYRMESEYSFGLKMKAYKVEQNGAQTDTLEIYYYGFDAEGHQDSTVIEKYDPNLQTFVHHSATGRTYNATHAVMTETISLLAANSSGWELNARTRFVRNGFDENLIDSIYTYNNFQWEKKAMIVYKRSSYVIIIGTEELSARNTIKLAPNPVQNELTVLTDNNNIPSQLVVFDQIGKQVLSVKNTHKIRTEQLPAGIYFLQVETAKGKSVHRFIKQ